MKKTYTTPQASTLLLTAATILAASDEPGIHEEYIESPQLSNEREWSSTEWSEE